MLYNVFFLFLENVYNNMCILIKLFSEMNLYHQCLPWGEHWGEEDLSSSDIDNLIPVVEVKKEMGQKDWGEEDLSSSDIDNLIPVIEVEKEKGQKDGELQGEPEVEKPKKIYVLLYFILDDLPLEILDMICSFLRAEDIMMLRETLPYVRQCPTYKRLLDKTKKFNQMWNAIADYRYEHEHCIHVCLPQVSVNPHNEIDGSRWSDDQMQCDFGGRGVFCLPHSDDKMDCLYHEMDERYSMQVVPLKKHFTCDKDEDCGVEEDSEDYEETIRFENRIYITGGGPFFSGGGYTKNL
jgi:hypothetical protein